MASFLLLRSLGAPRCVDYHGIHASSGAAGRPDPGPTPFAGVSADDAEATSGACKGEAEHGSRRIDANPLHPGGFYVTQLRKVEDRRRRRRKAPSSHRRERFARISRHAVAGAVCALRIAVRAPCRSTGAARGSKGWSSGNVPVCCSSTRTPNGGGW